MSQVSIPDTYFCDVCKNQVTDFQIAKYTTYKQTGSGRYDNIKVIEIDVCEDCEPANAFFDCNKKQTLMNKIILIIFKKETP